MMVKKHCTECMQIAIKNEYLYTQKLLLMALGTSVNYTKVLFSKMSMHFTCAYLL